MHVERFLRLGPGPESAARLLNLGSGGAVFGPPQWVHVHLDLRLAEIRNLRRAVVGNVNRLPFVNEAADVALCVGQVLNLADVTRAIREIARILRQGAIAIVEFESNRSLEFLPRRHESSTQVTTFFNDRSVSLSLLNPKHVACMMQENGLTVVARRSFHILSSLALRITRNRELSAKFSLLDGPLSCVPALRDAGCNYMLVVRADGRPSRYSRAAGESMENG